MSIDSWRESPESSTNLAAMEREFAEVDEPNRIPTTATVR